MEKSVALLLLSLSGCAAQVTQGAATFKEIRHRHDLPTAEQTAFETNMIWNSMRGLDSMIYNVIRLAPPSAQ